MAKDIGQLGVTVRQWRNRESIPIEHWATIIQKAAERGHKLTLDDFGPVPGEVVAFDRARAAAEGGHEAAKAA